ncbi:diphthine--ammonia ligase [Staphylothermus hellenicus]|uniref:ATP binding protein n=1 Tax=Staphylothermus hellenicus (strain DSM 12710 / JCM 10830 / BK20S6-10-b1 / P8) TaxID=591019 RepID=D7D9F1_STAHD|nr:diphthine--ammonia ligase [Staphylothermus hellenicus]ADI32397.1 ATP binding protein [Staphylothermus hellenicus DSM 12710]
MKATILFTGGKDSTYALHLAYLQGFDIVVLSTIYPLYEYSMLYHKPIFDLLRLQAKSLGLPLESMAVYSPKQELSTLYKLLKRVKENYGVEAVVSGAVLSDYQRMRYSMICDELGLEPYTPLWRIDQSKYMFELVEHGIEFILISINTYGLPMKLLGKIITDKDVYEIINRSRKYGFNPAFEGGEAETLVVNSPLFRRRIRVIGRRMIKSPYEGVFIIDSYGFQ